MRYSMEIENEMVNLISNPQDIVNFDQHHFDSTNECHICGITILPEEKIIEIITRQGNIVA